MKPGLAALEHVAEPGDEGGTAVGLGDVDGVEVEAEAVGLLAGDPTVPSGESLSTSRMSRSNPVRARIEAASSTSASTASIEPAEL